VVLAFVLDFFPEEEKQVRTDIRKTVEGVFPQQAIESLQAYGLTALGAEGSEPATVESLAFSVVLVHGLDDPGKVWMNLAPALAAENIPVWQLRYPNDQPIADSARFFYQELAGLKLLGVSRIAIVAHSMGGLVSRELLTSPQIAYADKVQAEELPRVDALVMIGTPNHGSEMARFRGFGEFREQWVHLLEGRGQMLQGVFDGLGEAKIDLLPGSLFLTTLNERPHAGGVRMLIIAGNASPWNENDIEHLLDSAAESTPTAAQQMLVDAQDLLESMNNGLGDGVVTVESTRLDGIEHRVVPGNHLSMIRNVRGNSSRIPPSVPLVLAFLEQLQ
jgi:pimeloyl-ACP methyl ester carboxylesterase